MKPPRVEGRILRAATSILLAFFAVSAHSQQLAATPPMGWNSWNHFAGRVTDADVRAAADALVSSGMRDAGYIYVNIDDTWEGNRDANGNIQANSKFPNMKALADYVHSKGLKIGIYSSPGPKTCAGYEGSYGHEAQDAKTYAGWGFDYLKYDLCSYRDVMAKDSDGEPYKEHTMMVEAYKKMHDALAATGRPIVFSLCQYGWDDVWTWGASVGGNLWRTTGDINDTYKRMAEIGFSQNDLAKYAGPGHWNDPDMLEVGNGGMTTDEYRTHLALWAILAAPLIAGNDLSKMSAETKALLMNRGVIAIDQDRLGRQGHRAWRQGTREIWVRPLSGGAMAVGIFNREDAPQQISVDTAALQLPGSRATDLWTGKPVVLTSGKTFTVPAHGAVFLRVQR